uniref:Phosphatidylcholine 2-acylhydrolase n=1 Tax=Rhodnius prolixus TaxID=13249 RepID=T1H7X2_RHOPR
MEFLVFSLVSDSGWISNSTKEFEVYLGHSHNPWGASTNLRDMRQTRGKRSVVHLYNMVLCATGCNPLSYKGYGCYCGFLGSGYPTDPIDRKSYFYFLTDAARGTIGVTIQPTAQCTWSTLSHTSGLATNVAHSVVKYILVASARQFCQLARGLAPGIHFDHNDKTEN